MVGRLLSTAEALGWRRFWDGWIICRPCQGGADWRVPAHYDTPIGEAVRPDDMFPEQRCIKCCALPPLELTALTQVA
jgi:hypothetical protein